MYITIENLDNTHLGNNPYQRKKTLNLPHGFAYNIWCVLPHGMT